MAVAIAVVPATPQAGISLTTVNVTGATAGQFLSVLQSDPEYGSNWTTIDGTAVTAARAERIVRCDTNGAATFQTPLTFNKTYMFTVRPMTEQMLTTSALATTTVTPSQPNT